MQPLESALTEHELSRRSTINGATILIAQLVFYITMFWLGSEGLNFKSPFLRSFVGVLVFGSPFLAVFALSLFRRGFWRNIFIFIVSGVTLASWAITGIVIWITGDAIPFEADQHITLSNGRRLDLVFVDYGALGGAYMLHSKEDWGPVFTKYKSRKILWKFYPILKVKPDNCAEIVWTTADKKVIRSTVDDVLNNKTHF